MPAAGRRKHGEFVEPDGRRYGKAGRKPSVKRIFWEEPDKSFHFLEYSPLRDSLDYQIQRQEPKQGIELLIDVKNPERTVRLINKFLGCSISVTEFARLRVEVQECGRVVLEFPVMEAA